MQNTYILLIQGTTFWLNMEIAEKQEKFYCKCGRDEEKGWYRE